MFLGGPLHFLQGLRQRFVETLQLDEEHAVFPADGDCYAAIGSALCAADYPVVGFDEMLQRLEKAVDTNQSLNTLPRCLLPRRSMMRLRNGTMPKSCRKRIFRPMKGRRISVSTLVPPPPK